MFWIGKIDATTLLAEIESAAVRGWPALESMPVDGWLWRHTSGGSVRANSVAALAYTGASVEASIDAVEALARARGAPAYFAVTDVAAPVDLDTRLANRGYVRGEESVTMAAPVAANAAIPADVHLTREPSVQWLTAYLSGLSEDRRAIAPSLLAGLPASAVYISALKDGRVVSSGLTIPDGRVASVQCMATLVTARRQGGARRVLGAIAHLAALGGPSTLYLQTGADNVAAQALYEAAGFTVIGRYHTRMKMV